MSEIKEYNEFDREKLYDLMWSMPIKEICCQYIISNHDLRYHCKEMGIPVPRDSYWNSTKKNKEFIKSPLESKGEYYRSTLKLTVRKGDDPYRTYDPDLKNLENDIKTDKKTITQVPIKLTKPHKLISEFKHYLNDKSKSGIYVSRIFSKTLNITVGQTCLNRAILIADTIIKALEARGHQFSFRNYSTIVTVNSIDYEFRISERSKVTKKGSDVDPRVLSPTGMLFIEIGPGWKKTVFSDTDTTKLEDKIPSIIAKIELMAKQEIWQQKERKIWSAKQEEIRERELDIQRMKQNEIESFKLLIDNSERWHKANHLRDYIHAYETKLSSENQMTEEMTKWIHWAKEKADWYDPFIEKQDELLTEIDRNTLQKTKKSN